MKIKIEKKDYEFETSFPTPDSTADAKEVFAWLAGFGDDKLVADFLRSSIESQQTKDLRAYLVGRDREPGKTYTRDELKLIPRRLASATAESVQQFSRDWKIKPPRKGTGVVAKVKAAEEKARRSEQEKDAAVSMMLDMLRTLKPAEAAKRLEAMKAANLVPADASL